MALWTLTGEAGDWTGALLEGQETTSSFVCLPPGDYEFTSPEGVFPVRKKRRMGWEGLGGDGLYITCASFRALATRGLRVDIPGRLFAGDEQRGDRTSPENVWWVSNKGGMGWEGLGGEGKLYHVYLLWCACRTTMD